MNPQQLQQQQLQQQQEHLRQFQQQQQKQQQQLQQQQEHLRQFQQQQQQQLQQQQQQQRQWQQWQQQQEIQRDTLFAQRVQAQSQIRSQFANLEAEVGKLRAELAAGQLTQEELQKRQQNLMVQDERGDWWTVGLNTGAWYRYDGMNWVEANPGTLESFNLPPSVSDQLSVNVVVTPKSHWFLGSLTFLVSCALTCAVGFFAGHVVYEIMHNSDVAWMGAGIVWVIGFVLSVRLTRKIWRGRKKSS